MGERELITHSRLVAFRACRRRHDWAYNEGIRLIEKAQPLDSGTRFHDWSESWLAAGQRYAAGFDPFFGCDDPYEAAKLRAMALAYHARWHGAAWKVLATEVQFRTRITNPETGRVSQLYDLGGQIDNIVQVEEGGPDDGVWVVERKTAKENLSGDATYWMRLRLGAQASIYMIGARALGYDPRGVIYDVVRKPGQEPWLATPIESRRYTKGKGCKACGGKAGGVKGAGCFHCDNSGWEDAPRLDARQREEDETPGAYGARCFAALVEDLETSVVRKVVPRLDDEMVEHQIDIWQTVKALHEARVSGWRTRNTDSCFLFNRPCDYYDVCCGSGRIDDPDRFRLVGAHPELERRVQLPVVNDEVF